MKALIGNSVSVSSKLPFCVTHSCPGIIQRIKAIQQQKKALQ